MLVTLETSGGYAGLRMTSSVETDELPAAEMAEALRTLETIASESPASAPSAGTSLPRYRLTVHWPSGPQVVDVVETRVPAALRPLLVELTRRTRPKS
jgi:predicted oxidoreductase